MEKKINKDFYDKLPGFICETLENLINQYSQEEWFEKVWEEYRQHILTSNMDNMKMPGYVFNKYVGGKND